MTTIATCEGQARWRAPHWRIPVPSMHGNVPRSGSIHRQTVHGQADGRLDYQYSFIPVPVPFRPADWTHGFPVDVKQTRGLIDGVNQVARVLEVGIVAVAGAHDAKFDPS